MKEEWKVYIKGVPNRGNEVVKVLTNLVGGIVSLEGSNKDCIYFIDHDGTIDFDYLSSETAKIIMDNYREIKLPEKGKPKENEIYWYINLDGNIDNDIFDNSIFDNNMYNFGNCFKTKEEAEIAAKKIKHLLKEE